jgi:hypothetical protein
VASPGQVSGFWPEGSVTQLRLPRFMLWQPGAVKESISDSPDISRPRINSAQTRAERAFFEAADRAAPGD